MLTFVLIKKIFFDLLRLLQIFQTLKRLLVRPIFFEMLPVRKLKKVENHCFKRSRCGNLHLRDLISATSLK